MSEPDFDGSNVARFRQALLDMQALIREQDQRILGLTKTIQVVQTEMSEMRLQFGTLVQRHFGTGPTDGS